MIQPSEADLIRQVRDAEVRASVAETLVQLLQDQRDQLLRSQTGQAGDIAELRARIDQLLAALAAAREEARVAKSNGRQLTVEALIQSFAASAKTAAAALDGQALSSLHVEVRAALGVSGSAPGLVIEDATLLDPRLSGSVAFQLSPLPATVLATGSAPQAAALTVRDAAARLQTALDGPLPATAQPLATRAQVLASALAAGPEPPPAQLQTQIGSLRDALEQMATAVPAIRPSVVALVQRLASLPASPADADIQAVAVSLADIAAVIESVPG